MIRKENIFVITGGTKGLGKALLSELQEKGGNKIVVCGRSIKKTSLDSKTGVYFVKADVTREADMRKLARLAVKKFGHIDVWINNAGKWTPHASIEKMSLKKMHEIVEVNLFGCVHGSRQALQMMKKVGRGTIVNIISSSGLNGSAGSSGYCASKFAASGFTKSLRLEAEASGIQVMAVYSRGIKTHLFDEKRPAQYMRFMKPEYVARKILQNLKRTKPRLEQMIMK